MKDDLRGWRLSVDAIRWIVCHNPDEATRDKAQRDAHIARLEAELADIAAARTRTKDRAKNAKNAAARDKAAAAEDAHRRAECALVDHRTLGRYLRQSPTGRLSIDRAAVRAEERLDGLPPKSWRVSDWVAASHPLAW